MHPSIAEKRKEIADLCLRYHVRRLEVFGSAARGVDFDPERSDVDFLYELERQPGADYADAYFGLLEGLEVLFRRHIDLIEPTAVENPFMQAGIDRSREVVYQA